MNFLKAQAGGLAIGFAVLIVWAALDWLMAQHGVPLGRDYWSTWMAATAGASAVLTWRAV